MATEETGVKPPKRRVQFTLEIGADSRDDVIAAMNDLVWEMRRGNISDKVSSSPSCGYVCTYRESEHPTHEEYIAALEKWQQQEGSHE